jgi:hypothetical protein
VIARTEADLRAKAEELSEVIMRGEQTAQLTYRMEALDALNAYAQPTGGGGGAGGGARAFGGGGGGAGQAGRFNGGAEVLAHDGQAVSNMLTRPSDRAAREYLEGRYGVPAPKPSKPREAVPGATVGTPPRTSSQIQLTRSVKRACLVSQPLNVSSDENPVSSLCFINSQLVPVRRGGGAAQAHQVRHHRAARVHPAQGDAAGPVRREAAADRGGRQHHRGVRLGQPGVHRQAGRPGGDAGAVGLYEVNSVETHSL